MGAGDAFTAGFLAVTTRGGDVGGDVAEALRAGATVAAAVVAVAGDIEGLPTAAELALIQAQGEAVQR